MSGFVTVLAWIGLALGVVIAAVVVVLFNRIMRPVVEIERYAKDILDHAGKITQNLDGVTEAVRTRELATSVPALAVRYLQKLGLA